MSPEPQSSARIEEPLRQQESDKSIGSLESTVVSQVERIEHMREGVGCMLHARRSVSRWADFIKVEELLAEELPPTIQIFQPEAPAPRYHHVPAAVTYLTYPAVIPTRRYFATLFDLVRVECVI